MPGRLICMHQVSIPWSLTLAPFPAGAGGIQTWYQEGPLLQSLNYASKHALNDGVTFSEGQFVTYGRH